MRRIPSDKVARVVELRARGAPVTSIARELGLHRSTVYNYLARVQAFEDEGFLEEARRELEVFSRLYLSPLGEATPVSGQAVRLAELVRRFMHLPDAVVAQALLNAHWRRLKTCRRRRRSTSKSGKR